jgi:REP element-mobilizing transposase RayT
VADGRYFITIHLAGAIPPEGQERIRALSARYEQLGSADGEGILELDRRIYAEMESWLDRGERVTHLQQHDVARMVMEAIAFRQGNAWNVLEFVLMPSHLHLFLECGEGLLKQSLEQFKRWTGHEAGKWVDLKAARFWQDEWFDHWSRSDEEDQRIMQYIRQNPVKAGLVKEYHDWPYGSWSKAR